jgi:hypothetical protein
LLPLALKSAGGITLPAFCHRHRFACFVFGYTRWGSRYLKWVEGNFHGEKVIRIVIAILFIGIGIYYMLPWFGTLFTAD